MKAAGTVEKSEDTIIADENSILMTHFIETLKARGFEGEADISEQTRQLYSHDASLFELVPQMVVFPKNTEDLKRLVISAYFSRENIPGISLTARSGGTCM